MTPVPLRYGSVCCTVDFLQPSRGRHPFHEGEHDCPALVNAAPFTTDGHVLLPGEEGTVPGNIASRVLEGVVSPDS